MFPYKQELINLTKKKDTEKIRELLETLPKEVKGNVFEEYLRYLYDGNGWIAVRKGGRGDGGADILLYHPKTPQTVSYIIQAKNQKVSLSFDDITTELRKFEKKGKQLYKCNQYRLVSINGFVKEAWKLEEFNMKLQTWGRVEELIFDFDERKNEPAIDLLPHNEVVYEKVEKAWEKSNKVAVVQATGTGKSFIILKSISENLRNNSLVLAPSHIILNEIKKNGGWVSQNTRFITYSKLTHMSENEMITLEPKLIVLDEFHRVGADIWGSSVKKLLDLFPKAKILGTSATPIRYLDDNRDMGDEIFNGNIANNLPLTEAIIKRILPNPKYISALHTLDEEMNEINSKVGNSMNTEEEKQELLIQIQNFKAVWEKTNGIQEILKKHIRSNESKFIVFCKDKEHLEEMEWLVEKWFKKAKFNKRIKKYRVFYKENESLDELKNFENAKKEKTIHLLFTIDMLNEGLHVSDIDGVILLRPTESPNIFYQQIGRSIAVGNKKEPLIFDFVNNFKQIRSVDFIGDLFNAKRIENEKRKILNLEENDIKFYIYDETKEAVSLFTKINEKIKDEWDYMFQQLKDYKKEHGDCNVPFSYKNKKLAKWVTFQRRYFKMGFLSRQQREKLSTLGFVWEPLEEYWEEKYNDLRIYKDKYGDCLVPKNYKEDPSLAIWVFNIRKKYKQGKLSTEKMEKLNDIGFIPDAIEHKWNEMYKQLTEYKEKNGDCLVPLRYKENPELGRWVSNLKMLKKNNKLSEERVENLNKLNFNWNPQDNSWDEFYKELFDYKEKYGDCLLTEIDNANSRLKTWASDQRQHFKKKKLTKERIDKLKKIDFIFNIKDYIWEQKFNKMLQYLKKEGDLYIIHDNDLANWVILQRRLYKENKLLEYRLNKLESVGFIWDSKKELWEQRYKELIEYKKQYNTFSVSQSRNKILAGWVSKQRGYYRKGTLSEEKIALLNKIFFPWETKK